ncbi:MAG: acetyl-CoA C-acyltransferase [Myxococcales bacterium]|nr:acetyl-CoA C-acyltransferase [Myxococcales bacterium]
MARLNKDIVLVAGKRTPFGGFGGSLKGMTATDLAVHAAKATLSEIGADPSAVDAVFFGNVLQTSVDAIYLARHVGLRSGTPQATPALTLNRLCGSGFEAIAQAAAAIEMGDATVALAGGTESMSQAPHIVRDARWGTRFGKPTEFEDSLWACLTDTFTGMAMANTAEKLSRTHEISRQACDDYALESQQRYEAARAAGVFEAEIAPITLKSRRGDKVIGSDEHARPQTTAEGLGKLRAVFEKDGVVTAGNASGIVDGAAAVLVTTRERAEAEGWPVLARVVSYASTGCDPTVMGIGPVPASKKALADAGKTVADMDIVEVNEAFAPQYLAVEKDLGLDRSKTNTNGGAIALGHPLGATGTRIMLHLAHELGRNDQQWALGTACIGGGQGIAIVLQRG